jgi:L-lactate dehydrogenase complex protein LldG
MAMNSRDTILARIREALSVTPSSHGNPAPRRDVRELLPEVGPDWEARRALFAQNAAGLKAGFELVPDLATAGKRVGELARAHGWKRVGTHRHPILDAVRGGLEAEFLFADAPHTTNDLESCDAGLTTCEALVAQTGSVLITNRACGGRALSVLPPHHVVVATRNQLVEDLPAAFALLRQKYDGDFPSCMSFITGPSRTGDIERILVLGAHGPRRLDILLVG